MTPDIQAAADRLRRHAKAKAARQAGADANQYRHESPYWNGEHNSHIGQDERILADAYLSLDPASLPRADDGEVITAQWLERCGGPEFILAEVNSPPHSSRPSFKTWLEIYRYDSHWRPCAFNRHRGDQTHFCLGTELRTRGDLRKLCLGLGITLKETE